MFIDHVLAFSFGFRTIDILEIQGAINYFSNYIPIWQFVVGKKVYEIVIHIMIDIDNDN